MEFEDLILTISSKIDEVSGYKKSIVQADLGYMRNDIEDVLFKLRVTEHSHQSETFPKLHEFNIETRQAIGLLFLSHVTYNLRSQLSYGSMWPVITDNLMQYERTTTFFKDNYLHNNHANPFLTTCIGDACERFSLRNAFDRQADEHYIRNTILLQMGLLNRFTNLNLWLSGYLNQTTIRVLLNKEDEYFSNSFTQGWRVLRRYRDNIIDDSVATSLLKQNVWFKEINIEEALRASRKKLGTQFLVEDEIENIFIVDQIFYEENVLKFIVNAEDIYALNLGGSDYSVYINNEYVTKVLRNEEKVLELDREIIIVEPNSFNALLELKNEDDDVVYSDEIVLFDLHDQVLIFDDKGNVYRYFSRKLPTNRSYTMLFDSDLDCDVAPELQVEYFSGYVTLVSGLCEDNNCLLSYDGEELFSLNFTNSIEKPEWIDHLVVYTADRRLELEESTKFHLKIFNMDDAENPLKELPEEAKIIRWTYSGGYVDEDDIKHFTADIDLSPELVCERKHSFLIRHQNQTYHRTVQSVIYDQTNIYHLMQRLKDGTIELIDRSSVLNYDELIQSKFHLALFNFEKSKDPRIIKDKMKLYGKVDLNKKFQPTSFPKFGETVIASEHIFNDTGSILFKAIRQGIIESYDVTKQTVIFNNIPKYFKDCEIVVLDDAYQISSLNIIDLKLTKNRIELENEYLSLVILYEDNYIGSFVQYEKIDFNMLPDDVEILKVLHMSYAPLLIMDKPLLVDWIEKHLITFFKGFMADSFETPGNQTIYFNFDEVNTTIEHLLYDVEFFGDEARTLLQEFILNGWAEKALKLPILLVYLLTLAQDMKLVSYFLSFLPEVDVPNERDGQFIDSIVSGLFKHRDLNRLEKHNLKIAMHHKNKIYYLKEALQKLLES